MSRLRSAGGFSDFDPANTLGLLVRQVVINLPSVTGGAGGLGGFPALHFLDLGLASPTIKFYLVFGVVLLAAFGSRRLTNSITGRALIASSEDEIAALASGVDVGTFSYVDPETMPFHVSSMILTMVILGGAGNVPSATLAARARHRVCPRYSRRELLQLWHRPVSDGVDPRAETAPMRSK